MKYKNAALAVLFSASLAVAVQDFGVVPGIPNVFSAGEVAVADDVNENFEWVENELDALDLVDQFQDDRIDDIEDASKQRTQSFTALGEIYTDTGPLPEEGAVRGGWSQGYWGFMTIPMPQDWDPSTEITVTFNLLNLVSGSGQSGQDVEIDLYGDMISPGDPTFDPDHGPFDSPGPETSWDFYANCFVSVPTVDGGGGGPLVTQNGFGGLPHLVSGTFTISASRIMIGAQAAAQMRINLFEPSNPLVMGGKGGGGGGGSPLLTLNTEEQLTNPVYPPCFVTIEYTAL